jgi:hypothetical protein
MLTEEIGAGVEKFATTRTGEPTALALGETIVMSCAKAKVVAKRNTNDVKTLENLSTNNPPQWFCASRTLQQ